MEGSRGYKNFSNIGMKLDLDYYSMLELEEQPGITHSWRTLKECGCFKPVSNKQWMQVIRVERQTAMYRIGNVYNL